MVIPILRHAPFGRERQSKACFMPTGWNVPTGVAATTGPSGIVAPRLAAAPDGGNG
jgi:hypothetical protein